MNDMVKIALIAAATSVVVFFGANLLVGDNQPEFGGTRFPSGLSADGTSPTAGEVRGTAFQLDNGSATTSLVADKLCITGTETDGTVIYYYFGAGGDWATSSTSCL